MYHQSSNGRERRSPRVGQHEVWRHQLIAKSLGLRRFPGIYDRRLFPSYHKTRLVAKLGLLGGGGSDVECGGKRRMGNVWIVVGEPNDESSVHTRLVFLQRLRPKPTA